MQLLANFGGSAGACALLVTAISSARNMMETLFVVRNISTKINNSGATINSGVTWSRQESTAQMSTMLPIECEKLSESIKKLKRRELLSIFLESEPPVSVDNIQGDWNGILLQNNRILTATTAFISNVLFSNGGSLNVRWNGKQFTDNSSVGINRFSSKRNDGAFTTTPNSDATTILSTANPPIRYAQQFSYEIRSSAIQPDGKSLMLDYSGHHFPLSLWHSMRDEIRCLPIPDNADYEAMIGMGCMGWSGGSLNSAPFLLWRKKT